MKQTRLRPRRDCFMTFPMTRRLCKIPWLVLLLPAIAPAQIDPVKRDLIQIGYNQPLEGRAPLAGYAVYYHNQPDFLRTNLTLRVALAPVYLDSELGFVHGLGPDTDFAIGAAGGGFADSYNEIRGGKWIVGESFDGHRRGNFRERLSSVQSAEPDTAELCPARRGALFDLRRQRQHGAKFSTAR